MGASRPSMARGLHAPCTFTPCFVVNSVHAAVAAPVDGLGVTGPFFNEVAEHVHDGRLRIVLKSAWNSQ